MQQFFMRLSKALHFWFLSSAWEIIETEVSDFLFLLHFHMVLRWYTDSLCFWKADAFWVFNSLVFKGEGERCSVSEAKYFLQHTVRLLQGVYHFRDILVILMHTVHLLRFLRGLNGVQIPVYLFHVYRVLGRKKALFSLSRYFWEYIGS